MKSKNIKLLLLWCLFISLFSVSKAEDLLNNETDDFDVKIAVQNINELKWNIDNLTQELFDLDKKETTEDGLDAKYREVRKEIVRVITDINNNTEDIYWMIKKISDYKKQIFLAYKELKEIRDSKTMTKEYISDFSNFVYKLSNKYDDSSLSSIDDLKLIINSDNIPLTLANDYLAESMLLQLWDMMETFDDKESKQISLIKKYHELKSQKEKETKDYEIEIEKLNQKKNYLLQFIALYKNDKIQRQTTIKQLFESTKWVYDKMNELVKWAQKWVYKTDFDMEKKLKELDKIEKDDQTYPISWPIYPIEDILTYFWDSNYQIQYGIPHIWIQIKATQNTTIYAVRDWVVYFVADNNEIWINRIMILHTDWYISTYQYINQSIVKAWDIVKRWQLIWYSWWEPGTRWAGFISKWSNLTFWIFKDGIAIDPFDILDASIVKEKDALPEGYQIKYLRDKYTRAIDITNLDLMSWATLREREYQFLRRYWVWAYKDVTFRENVVKWTNIDKDMVICVAFAESTLWKYLSTSNNIWNVWNNDRWDRIPFYSAYVWARAIPVTLNNAYLWKYHTINQLSRYWNKDGKIYASSPINRQTNVLKCLSQIKGYYIPEDFPFRTGPNPNLVSEDKEYVEFASWALTPEVDWK